MKLDVRVERFPLRGAFTISRGARTHAQVVVAEISQGGARGRGECTPYPRYGETVEGVVNAISAQGPAIADGLTREGLQSEMKAGAARNALDCALWDLEAKRTGRRVWELAGLPEPKPVKTVFTISLADPAAMENATREAVAAGRDLLKVKLGAGDGGDDERIRAVRRAAPGATLLVDANEGWKADELERYLAAAREAGVVMVEQPLPAGEDAALADLRGMGGPGVLLGADESVHTAADIEGLRGAYDVMNFKLDKAGGLTEGLAFLREAQAHDAVLMVGCMMATSLAMAPAVLPAQAARFVDLDGPLWMAEDREPGLRYDGQIVQPPSAEVWG